MKKYLLACSLIAGVTLYANDAVDKHDQPVYFDNFFISFIDGTNFINIQSILEFGQRLVALMRKSPVDYAEKLHKVFKLNLPHPLARHTEGSKVGLVWFKDAYWGTKDLRAYEKSNPNDPALKAALTHACSHFERFSEEYVGEIDAAKGIMIQIITQWSELREKPTSMLLDWSKVEGLERDSLYGTMTTFEIFDTFLSDLLLFLKDLVRNCPKSYHKYQEQLKQARHGSTGKA